MKILDRLNHNNINGTTNSDLIYGTNSSDIIIGGKDNDTYFGGAGDDIYYYRIGDGNDSLKSSYQINDKILFSSGIVANNITISTVGNDKVLSFSQGGSITIENSGYADGNNPKLQFSDGSIYQIQGHNITQISGPDSNKIITISDGLVDGVYPLKNKTHNSFNIEFDYSYDVNHLFTDEIKSNLEYAASLWENAITSDFADIAAGTQITVFNPNNGQYELKTLGHNVDDLIIYVGAIDFSFSWFNGYATALASSKTSLMYQGRNNNASAYQPAVGTITFATNPAYLDGTPRQWFIDSTPNSENDVPKNSNIADFILVAAHEIGHILGIGSGSQAYANLIYDNNFYGTDSTAIYGSAVPVTGVQGHIGNVNGEIPLLAAGGSTQRTPTALDYAILSDIGYGIDFNEDINLETMGFNGVYNAEASIGSDILRGNTLNNVLYGLAGDDQIWGGAGGIDTLIDDSGENMFWWSTGDSNDWIGSYGKGSAINFYGFNFDQRDAGYLSDGSLWIGQQGKGDKVTIAGWLNQDTSTRIQSFVFLENGIQKSFAWNNGKDVEVNLNNAYRCTSVNYLECVDYSNAILRGSNGNDTIVGGTGSDSIWGGYGGNDWLNGNIGADKYWFNGSDGNDTISSNTTNYQDSIMFYGGMNINNICGKTISGNNLILTLTSGNNLTLQNWTLNDGSKINDFDFGVNGIYSLNSDASNWARIN